MHQIESGFRQRKEQAAAQRRRRRLHRWLAAGAGSLLLTAGLAVAFTWDRWSIGRDDQPPGVEAEEPVQEAAAPVFIPAIVDLAGDPMVINLGGPAGNAPKTRDVARPEKLMFPGISDQVTVLADTMLSSSERFMTTLPSSQEDFAFFQAQRSRAAAPIMASSAEIPTYDPAPADGEAAIEDDPYAAAGPGDIPDDAEFSLIPAEDLPESEAVDPADIPMPADEPVQMDGELADPALPPVEEVEGGAGWGETVGEGNEALPDFKRTRVEDNTSLTFLTPELERFQQTEDFFVRVKSSRSLDGIVAEQGFSPDDARLAGEALKGTLAVETLEAGDVVAMRGYRPERASPGFRLMQVSIYAQQTYRGTIARADDGAFVAGADPWVADDLFNYSEEDATDAPVQQYRLLDAIYSTAARNSVPTGVIGEAIMLLSRSADLNAFAARDDRFLLAYSHEPRDGNAGRVLYVAVRGEQKTIECYVFRPAGGGDFTCMTEDNQSVTVTVTNGMVTPVNGVMRSTFGPRKHPILKVVRLHKGVDWAAPVGTPVFAAFDGKVSFAGDGADYGNLIRISHGGGRETRYAHLSRFADKTKVGTEVKAGDVIGYVGTTGLSTGPHLHFELYAGGQPIDPLQSAVAAVRSDSSAVEKLVDRIIHVESGGNARAKNPLSSATGLGQFIDSTWLRMMRTYRPDLARSLSTADQLALRFDATISREMVRHLAQEGEAYLRARGHAITAGRLYLCHFLGMEGAHVVLAASPDAALIDVLGPGVIRANPFLTGQNVAHVVNWAERKMSGKARSYAAAPETTTKTIMRASPDFERYREGVREIMAAVMPAAATKPDASKADGAAAQPVKAEAGDSLD